MATIRATDGGSVVIPLTHMEGVSTHSGCVCDTTASLEAVRAHLMDGTLDTTVLSISNTKPMFDLLNAATALGIQSLVVPIAEFVGAHIKTCTKENAAAFLGTDAGASGVPRVCDSRESAWLGALE